MKPEVISPTHKPPKKPRRALVQRMSLSMPADIYDGLSTLVQERGYENRSQAVAEIVRKELIHEKRSNPDSIMAGTICLFYDEFNPGLRDKVSQILRNYLKEVVASLGVMLEQHQRMEVLVVQGPVRILDALIANLNACRGLETGKLSLTNAILPPLHGSADTVGPQGYTHG